MLPIAADARRGGHSSRRFPVAVTYLPVTRCQICYHTVAYRPGNLSEVLTRHYRRAHLETLGPFPVADHRDPDHPPMPPQASAGSGRPCSSRLAVSSPGERPGGFTPGAAELSQAVR
jgi:hypothetical protein